MRGIYKRDFRVSTEIKQLKRNGRGSPDSTPPDLGCNVDSGHHFLGCFLEPQGKERRESPDVYFLQK